MTVERYSRKVMPSKRSRQPVLVFVHGLLGNASDWVETLSGLQDYPCIRIDLPGHGLAKQTRIDDFEGMDIWLSQILAEKLEMGQPYVLIGYSLGARIIMHALIGHRLNKETLVAAIMEGGHFGLKTEKEKQQRWQSDCHWAYRFKKEPIEQVLTDWYQQPVFSDLNHEQRQELIHLRSANLGTSIGNMILATSLSKQPYLLEKLTKTSVPVHYIAGEKDKKFCQLAEQSGLSFSQIAKAGHNAHKMNPHAFARVIEKFLLTLM